jgi:hypothetical protein
MVKDKQQLQKVTEKLKVYSLNKAWKCSIMLNKDRIKIRMNIEK